jgi:HD superfamily phosphohydrolase/serine/threonine protein kinase
MTHDVRLEFDIAYALSILSFEQEIPFGFPKVLEITAEMKTIIDDCLDRGTFTKTTCKVRDNIAGAKYSLRLGNDTYTLPAGATIRAGGSGVTLPIYDERVSRKFALKVPRVSVLAYELPPSSDLDEKNHYNRVNSEYETFENERNISRRIIHQNVAQSFYGDRKPISGKGGMRVLLPYSISEWIDGKPLHEFLNENDIDIYGIISLISDTFAGLAHTHRQNVLHWDIKSDNVLVGRDRVAKIIDFGNAKLLDSLRERRGDDYGDLQATTTQGKYPDLKVFSVASTGEGESRRFRIAMPDLSWNHRYIDIWMLAQEWNRCLGFSENYRQGHPDLDETSRQTLSTKIRTAAGPRLTEAYECLRIIFDRILFPFSQKYNEQFVGLGGSFEASKVYYRNADEVLAELVRIRPPFGAGEAIPELLVTLDDIVRLPVTGNSVFTERVAAVVDQPIIEPTKRHLQLAQVRQVFPGATHTRFEHLLGTLSTTAYFVRSLYLNDMNAFWRVSGSAEEIRAVLFASILHDAGHLAFGHFIEEMTDLMEGSRHLDFVVNVLEVCIDKLGAPRKAVAGPASPFRVTEIERDSLINCVKDWWCSDLAGHRGSDEEARKLFEKVLRLFNPEPWRHDVDAYLFRTGTQVAMEYILRSIIDGPIDADKLDYLRRDSFHSGVFFSGGIDLERFFESLRVCINTGRNAHALVPSIGVSEKGIAPIETIITARYHLFSAVYWHRTVRCITAMLQRVISEVRLRLADPGWDAFFSDFLFNFRHLDDREAVVWLRKQVEASGFLDASLAPGKSAQPGVTRVCDLLDALAGDRNKYFQLAFELSYVGNVGGPNRVDLAAREKLHDAICAAVHPEPAEDVGQKERRQQLAAFCRELEVAFASAVEKQTGKAFSPETILLDVPEPGKDQVHGLQVDRRSKRSTVGRGLKDWHVGRERVDFFELTAVSPITAALADVFRRWARKVRIFMTQPDMERLRELQLEAGDVAEIWEIVLTEKLGKEA